MHDLLEIAVDEFNQQFTGPNSESLFYMNSLQFKDYGVYMSKKDGKPKTEYPSKYNF